MSTTFDVSDILATAAREANVPPFSTDTNVTLAQSTYWLVQGARSFSARLKQALGDDGDYLKIATLTTVPNLNFVSLPADCGEIHSLLWARTSSDYRLLRTGNMEVLEDLADGDPIAWSTYADPQYRIEGETIAFYPPSTDAETLYLFYADHLQLEDQTYFAARLDADRWLALDVAIRVVQSQGRDPSMLKQDKLMLEAGLFSSARRRAPKTIQTIRDTRSAELNRGLRDRWRR